MTYWYYTALTGAMISSSANSFERHQEEQPNDPFGIHVRYETPIQWTHCSFTDVYLPDHYDFEIMYMPPRRYTNQYDYSQWDAWATALRFNLPKPKKEVTRPLKGFAAFARSKL